jgi:hypothetical protein
VSFGPRSPLSDEEIEKTIPGYRRRLSIFDRRADDLAQPITFLLLRPTATSDVPLSFDRAAWSVTDVEDTLVKCFWCRADGWLGVGQVETPKTRKTCQCCYATLMAVGIVTSKTPGTVLRADPAVPKRLPRNR